MTTRCWLTLGLTALLGAAPAAGDTVLGFFEGRSGGGNGATGSVPLTGWAVSGSGVERVVIQVDGVNVGTARYHGLRPAVTAAVPGFPDSDAPGFVFQLNSTDHLNGLHTVSAEVTSKDGTRHVIAGSQVMLFNNNTHNLLPFGHIDRPKRNAQLYGVCDLEDPQRRYTPVTGWVLDLGVEIGDTGVGYVELLVDGSIVANSRRDCRFDAPAGGFRSCYGLPRFDIERIYPFALDAPSSGFRFALDLGVLLNSGYAEGHHVLTIRSGDISGQVANADEIPVTFFCVENIPNEGSIGFIEEPGPGQTSGFTRFQGWAVDWQGVAVVRLLVDGVFIDNADYGVGRRAIVEAEFPGYPDVLAPLWRAFIDTTQFSDGFHQLQVEVIDLAGERTVIGETTFFVLNHG